MRKQILLFLTIMSVSFSKAQISIGANSVGKLEKFKPEVFKNFKNTTTIFVLSNAYDKASYDAILKDSWNITPYEIVSPNDFDFRNYLTDKYSFAHLRSYTNEGSSTFFIHSNIDFYMLDLKEINEKIEKVKDDQEKFVKLIIKNKINVGSILLHTNTEMLARANKNFGSGGGFALVSKSPEFYAYSKKTGNEKLSDYKKEMIDLVYDKNSFNNLTLGLLKNNLQQINNSISKEEFVWAYGESKSTEIKKLKTATLYLSENLKTRYNPNKFRDEEWKTGELEKIVSKYKYTKEFISQAELDQKIKNAEDFFYLRLVKVNSEKFVEVVNGKSGEVVYHNYETGMSEYNIKEKDFENLNKAIL